MRETEIKILNVNPDELSEKLDQLGAEKGFSGLVKVKYFDSPEREIRKRGDLLRVREFENSHTEVTYKTNKRIEGGFKNYDEYELEGKSFDEACRIFEGLKYETTAYYEKKRTVYKYKNAEIVIDEYPKIPPFIEIEASDTSLIEEIITDLGLSANERSAQTIGGLLKEKYPDIELNGLTF